MYYIADNYLPVECIGRLMANLLSEHIKRNNNVPNVALYFQRHHAGKMSNMASRDKPAISFITLWEKIRKK